MITVSAPKLRRLEKHLVTFARKAVPYAVRNGLNDMAFEARKEWVEQLKGTFTLRNTWTERGLRVDKAGGRSIAQMESRVGSLRDYMAEREQGSTQTMKGKHGIAIPMSGASGQGKKAKRTRAVRKQNYLNAIQVARRVSGSRARKNAVAVAMALKHGGVAYIEVGKRKGLFRVTGGKRGPKLRLLYDLTKSVVQTKPYPTLENTLQAIAPRLPGIQMRALEAELKRNKVLWYGAWG